MNAAQILTSLISKERTWGPVFTGYPVQGRLNRLDRLYSRLAVATAASRRHRAQGTWRPVPAVLTDETREESLRALEAHLHAL